MQFIGSKDRRYIYEDFSDTETAVDEEDESAYKINTKGKVMIAVYALVVLTIFALIIMNTRLIKNMNESINEQEMRIETLMQEQQELQAQYEFVSSDEEVLRKASEMGMVRA
jgi:cell division protein FtsL